MKYIGNAFSINMIPDEAIISIKTITKTQFIRAGKHAKSIIGHPEIADLFNLKLNREGISLKKGDMLYIVTPSQRLHQKERVEDGAAYRFVPESEGYTYKIVQVLSMEK